MAHLWKSFADSFAPPKQSEQPRREGVAPSCTVDEHQLSHHESCNQNGGQSSRANPESQEVQRADLNRAPARETSARVAEVDLGSEEEFQDSKEEATPPRSLAQSIAVPRVPQSTLQTT